MLQTLRDKTSGWIATAILGLLVVPFAFFGMEQYLFQRNDTFAAKVEAPPTWWRDAPAVWPVTMLWQRDEISADDFRKAFERTRQQQRQQEGEQFDSRAFESKDNKRKVLDSLVDQRVLAMTATRNGIAVTDGQVRDEIQRIPAFQVEGKFNPQRYQLALASQAPSRTPRQFEQDVRDGLRESMIPTAVGQSAFATQAELQQLLRLLGEKRDVSFAILPAPAPDAGPISAVDIQKWYDSHTAAYRAPETVALEYVEVDAKTLPVATPNAVDDAALRQRYTLEKTHFIEPEQRLAAHILIKVDASASPAAQKAAQAKAEALAQQARQPGADFAALARANSDDTGSKAAGGDLGWVAKDVMVKPFEDALFAMQPGEIRGPVKSEFGWHIIQLREIKAGKQVPFEQAHEQLAREQADADRDRSFNDLIGKLVDQINKNPTSLAPAARLAGLPVQQTGSVARGQGTGIAANLAVQRVAFSESMIEDGTVSDPIELGPGHSVLIRVAQHTQAHQLPLAQVAQRVIAAIRGDRAAKAQSAAADRLVAQVNGGKPLKELATAQGLITSEVPAVPRDAPVPDKVTSAAVFKVRPPAPGKVSAGKVVLADGRAVVFAVSRVVPGNPAEATPEQKASLQQQLAQLAGNDDVESLVHTLRKRMVVTIAEDRL
ncbi:MAG: peptidylprolyl isomerase [Xanthomonadaceae bacterium]|nr:peptidylprolyl isomerase [Xanthomonadaceae bacterium]